MQSASVKGVLCMAKALAIMQHVFWENVARSMSHSSIPPSVWCLQIVLNEIRIIGINDSISLH